jgi:hypothetical protein
VRASAIAALARVDTVEAAEFMLGVLAHGSPPDGEAAYRSLREARVSSFMTLAQREVLSAAPPMRATLQGILG